MRQRAAVARHPRRDVKRHQRLEHNPRVPVFIRQTLHKIVQVCLQYIEYILNVLLKSILFCSISPFFSGHKVRTQQFNIEPYSHLVKAKAKTTSDSFPCYSMYFYRPPMKNRYGNVFSVCLSVQKSLCVESSTPSHQYRASALARPTGSPCCAEPWFHLQDIFKLCKNMHYVARIVSKHIE